MNHLNHTVESFFSKWMKTTSGYDPNLSMFFALPLFSVDSPLFCDSRWIFIENCLGAGERNSVSKFGSKSIGSHLLSCISETKSTFDIPFCFSFHSSLFFSLGVCVFFHFGSFWSSNYISFTISSILKRHTHVSFLSLWDVGINCKALPRPSTEDYPRCW